MKLILTKIVFFITLICTYSQVNAQGIKVDLFGYSGLSSEYTSSFYYGIGYDQNVGDKISLGFSYIKGYSIDPDYSKTEQYYSFIATENNLNYNVEVGLTALSSWHSFSYTSKYFFDDNSDGGYYFSTGISMLQTEIEYDVHSISVDQMGSSNAFGISQGLYKQKLTLIPISIDLGSRSEFDGWYYELYAGASLLPFGAKKDVSPSFLKNIGVETKFNPVSFHISLCVGVSWAD